MSKPIQKNVIIAIIVIAILAVAAIIYGMVFVTSKTTQPAEQTQTDTTNPNEVTVTEYDPATAEQWVKDALVERTMGDEKAPVTIIDYSSLTCPHCADFHLKTLPQVKKDYIDTGKAKLVFSDFPLNLPALQATAMTRCIKDNDAYFAMIEQLFRTQSEWGASQNARDGLINSVKFSGLSREEAAKCIDSQQLISGLLQHMDEGKTKNSVNSTPTFVLIKGDKTEKVQGAVPYADFKAAMDKLK